MTPKKAEAWRPRLEISLSTECGGTSCLGNGKDAWGVRSMTCPLWEAAAVLGLEPGKPTENLNKRLSAEGKEPLLFQ